MQTLQKRSARLSRSARMVLVFLCNVLIIVFDHTLSVYAADSYRAIYYLNYREALGTSPYQCVVTPDHVITNSYQDSSSNIIKPNSLYVYDVKLPLSLHFDSKPRDGSYTVSGKGNIRISVMIDYDAYLLSAYTDNTDVCSIHFNFDNSTLKKNEWNSLYYELNFYELPCNNVDSSVFYLHLTFASFAQLDLSHTIPLNFKASSSYYGVNFPDSAFSRDTVVGSIEDVNDTIKDNRNEDRQDAEQGGEDATDLVKNLDDSIKSKWEILWYPIEFTTRVASVFGAGTSAVSYKDTYADVVGYKYDEQSGYLVPLRDRSRAQARAGGTVISFPSFSLMGMQIWDAYDFDLSQLKSWFPELFNLLYVAISILEVYWFVSFLRSKYDEVFG